MLKFDRDAAVSNPTQAAIITIQQKSIAQNPLDDNWGELNLPKSVQTDLIYPPETGLDLR